MLSVGFLHKEAVFIRCFLGGLVSYIAEPMVNLSGGLSRERKTSRGSTTQPWQVSGDKEEYARHPLLVFQILALVRTPSLAPAPVCCGMSGYTLPRTETITFLYT
jgi:hypothetical protein